ncbi:DUF3137 domain-containing protein [Chitinophaga sp. HK235]|uniref:DUF3137 domain-containing protein n=1 Tax=Chitinophaga sp. HK235 TaxID=2952571 RepID=UPI001BAACD83|nr:DUF3137 domain-containing protein [Chitinophaga sp. HK235]
MKTLEEFNAFVDQQLQTQLQQLETRRLAGRAWVRRMRILGVLPMILFFIFLMWVVIPQEEHTKVNSTSVILYLVGGIILTLALSFGIRRYMLQQKGAQEMIDYEQDFKNTVVKPIVAFINPTFTYQPLNHASYDEFTESGLFARKDYNVSGNDQVFGKVGEMSFQCCDLKVTSMPALTLRGLGPDVVFEGTWFVAQFPRYFNAPVYIVSRSAMADNLLSSGNTEAEYIETWNLGKKVTASDTAFNRLFIVFAKDPDEAQQLLTSELQERIIRLQERSQAPLFISFYNNRIYIGIGHGHDYFEAGLQESLADRRVLTNYYMDLVHLLQIIEDLQQNGQIWTSTAFTRS